MITNSTPAFHEKGPVRYLLFASSTVLNVLYLRCSAVLGRNEGVDAEFLEFAAHC